jgi:hypothetical protein
MMRVPDSLLNCVGFVSRDQDQPDYRASAFVVSVPHDAKSGYLHLVTAKHVAVQLQNGEAMIALNGKDGLPLWMKNGNEVPWFFHPETNVDVAILPMASIRLNEYDYQDISTAVFLTEERNRKYGVGIGDEVVNVGLFRPYYGDVRLIPLVRTGTVAMMPARTIPHPKFGTMDAYLVEGRSIGGLSGSPVFVRSTVQLQTMDKDGEAAPCSALGQYHLLGLISGHLETLPNQDSQYGVNMGFSIVVPAAKIYEGLFSGELTALREEAFKRGSLTNN